MLTRRQTLRSLAAAAAFSQAFMRAQSSSHHMYLSLNSVLVNNRVPWPEFPKLAAQVGYPGTDVMLKPAMSAGASATNRLLDTLNLRPACMELPVEFRKDDATFRAGLAELDPCCAFAAAINCPKMMTWIMPSSNTPADELRRLYKERFTACAKVMARHNVRLALEFIGPLNLRKMFRYEFIWRMNDMLAFAKECGSNVGLQLDSWHWYNAGATTEDIIAAGRDRIVHIHFNDAPNLPLDQLRDNQRLFPGDGVINLTGFLRALQTIGYTGGVSVEVFGAGNNMTPEEAAKVGLTKSLAVFKKAGVPEG